MWASEGEHGGCPTVSKHYQKYNHMWGKTQVRILHLFSAGVSKHKSWTKAQSGLNMKHTNTILSNWSRDKSFSLAEENENWGKGDCCRKLSSFGGMFQVTCFLWQLLLLWWYKYICMWFGSRSHILTHTGALWQCIQISCIIMFTELPWIITEKLNNSLFLMC